MCDVNAVFDEIVKAIFGCIPSPKQAFMKVYSEVTSVPFRMMVIDRVPPVRFEDGEPQALRVEDYVHWYLAPRDPPPRRPLPPRRRRRRRHHLCGRPQRAAPLCAP